MKVLIPVDGSAASKSAASLMASTVTDLWDDVHIELLTVLARLSPRVSFSMSDTELKNYYTEEAEEIFAPLRKSFDGKKFTVKEKYVLGEPLEGIAKEARTYTPDLIVMGTEGVSALEGAFVGSVAFGILSRIAMPVLLLRRGCSLDANALHMGIAVDGGKESKLAVTRLMEHISLFKEKPAVSLLTVIPDMDKGFLRGLSRVIPANHAKAWKEKKAERSFKTVRAIVQKAGIEAKEVVLTGSPGQALTEHAEKKLDMLVMGSHGYGRIESAIMGSVGMQVASHCQIPLLIIR